MAVVKQHGLPLHQEEEDPQVADLPWNSLAIWHQSGFVTFLNAHQIDLQLLRGADSESKRFFRLKNHCEPWTTKTTTTTTTKDLPAQTYATGPTTQAILASLKDDFQHLAHHTQVEILPVPWLHGFFSVPVEMPLARTKMYQQGQLYGIDASSGFAVSLLKIHPGDHVLDLCCAPGAKLTMIADLLRQKGSVTGVDFSRQRIGVAKQLVHKYNLVSCRCMGCSSSLAGADAVQEGGDHRATSCEWRCRLFCADGRTFAVGPKTECEQLEDVETIVDSREIATRSGKSKARKRLNKSARARLHKRPRVWLPDSTLYDKVLVDAECTHDGSVRHLQKNKTLADWHLYVKDHLNDQEVHRILELQHDLIRNGFKLLRPGGTMIYSTCSLSIKQNEEIVRAFLDEHASHARIVPIPRDGLPCEGGRINGTVRFTPSNDTSGLFIARIQKFVKTARVEASTISEL